MKIPMYHVSVLLKYTFGSKIILHMCNHPIAFLKSNTFIYSVVLVSIK